MLTVDASLQTHVQVGKCCHRLAAGCYYYGRGKCGIVQINNVPFYVVDFVCILAFLSIFFIRLIPQYLNSIPTSSLILTGFGHREQLSHLILSRKNRHQLFWSLNGPQYRHTLRGLYYSNITLSYQINSGEEKYQRDNKQPSERVV